jgi:MoxR-like ATPase
MNIHTNSEQKIAELTSQEMSIRAISKTVGLSKSQVGRIIQKQKISSPATQPITKVAKIVKATAVKTNNSTAKTQTFIKLDKTQQKAKYEVSEEMKKYVPSIDGYIARKIGKTTDVDILTTAYEHNQNVLLVGECGTGKTKIISHIAYKKQLPYARVNLNGGTTPDQLIGHFVPNGEGGLKWQDGLLTQFVRHGGILAVDEINSCASEILFFLYPLLDDERKLTLVDKDSEVIIANKNFMLIATMNPAESGYEGRRPLDAGLKDRFHIKLFYDYDEAIENKLVKSKKILELARKLRFMRSKNELSTPVSLRMLIYYDNNSELFGEKVAFDMFLNSFESHEREPIRNVLEMIEKPVKVEAEPPTVLAGSNKVVTP